MSSGDIFADSKEAEAAEGQEVAEDSSAAPAESLDLLAETDSEVTAEKEGVEQDDVEMSEDVGEMNKTDIDEVNDEDVSGANEEAADDPGEEDTGEVSQEEVEEAEVSQEGVDDDTETATKATAGDGETPEKAADKLFRFPQGTIKRIMKLDPEVNMVNGEAIFLISKATEQFIQCLTLEASHFTSTNKKKTLAKGDVTTAIESTDCLAFLDGAMED